MAFLGLYLKDGEEVDNVLGMLESLSSEERRNVEKAIPSRVYEKLVEQAPKTLSEINGGSQSQERDESPDQEPRFLGLSSGFENPFHSSVRGLHMNHQVSDFAECRKLIDPAKPMDLLDIYFAYFHPSYPMVDKRDIVKTAMTETSNISSGKNCLLWTVLLYGWNLTELAKPHPDSKIVQLMQQLTMCGLKSRHSIETVQSLLLQAMFFWGKQYWSNAYMLVGDAVRMGIDLGLHLSNVASPSIARRTWKCCCMLDSLVSGRLGRRPQVTIMDYIDAMEPEDSEEEWGLWSPPVERCSSQPFEATQRYVAEPGRFVSAFNVNYAINKIANKYINRVNTNEMEDEVIKSELLKSTAIELKEWKDNLPSHLNLEAYMNTDFEACQSIQLLPHVVNLYFGYVSVCHLLHIVDTNFSLEGIIPSYDAAIDLARKTMYSFFSRVSPRKALPTFEYFLSLSMTVCLKMGVEIQGLADPLYNNERFNELLGYLKSCSEAWNGALISYNYWIKVQQSKGMDRGNSTSNSEITNSNSKNYVPYVFSSLQEFDGFPDLDSFSPILGTGRSCIGAMIESLEQGGTF
ncbi:hypothetical protein TRICI_003023 [Trichomonascus ciferrii]|uniref:Xylanolytic transcriptional activator regulatory domain-containing protein n=1 Tax=Trichomonascus ciferrii TaxID=44093 RepID=A0A642VA86_9ASCO|nr:hypothetical protein TRICI_003023 [Trichomonascus ciferrii]